MASGTSRFSSRSQVRVGGVALQGLRFRCGHTGRDGRLKFMLYCWSERREPYLWVIETGYTGREDKVLPVTGGGMSRLWKE